MAELLIGCVADDFTGASDIASFFVKAGLETLLINEVPAAGYTVPEGTDCIVIALKTRTMETEQAVRESMSAFQWLKQMGAKKLYFKYCSTFDSTRTGNIGPVTDAVMEAFGIPYTVLCPSLPVNGRTVKEGHLYVNGLPLHESHMKDHPLTPMRDSYLPALMKEQGKYPCYILKADQFDDLLAGMETPCYLVPDYYEEEHGSRIAEVFGDCYFYTGGSGLGSHLAAILIDKKGVIRHKPAMHTSGRAIILAGSCSAITLRQIDDYCGRGCSSYRIDPNALIAGSITAEDIFAWAVKQETVPLIYSSADAAELTAADQTDRAETAKAIEYLLSSLAVMAAAAGWRRIIVAGGETSGAVTKALGFSSFYISESIAPGVPVMIPAEEPELRLVLKSGNFGQIDFFDRAVVMTEEGL